MSEANKKRLQRFYAKYNPSKLDAVDKTLRSFEGKEDSLFSALVEKYGPEPVEEEVAKVEPKSEESVPAPAPTEQAPPPHAAEEGKAATAGEHDVSAPASSVDGEPRPVEMRLTRFFCKHFPTKVHAVPKLLEAFKGRETLLFQVLEENLGSEPSPNEIVPAYETYMRLDRFYSKYCPAKRPLITRILVTFAGMEGDLFEALVEKYGPEPLNLILS